MIKFAIIEKALVVIFFILIAFAVCLSLLLAMPGTAMIVLLVDFIVATLIAIFGSLRIRDEEEEKLFK